MSRSEDHPDDETQDGRGTTASDGHGQTLDASREPSVRADELAPLNRVSSQLYEIESEVARGGMGRVMRARDRRLGRVVALKFLRNAGPDQLARFEREAAITARLQHPAIVPVYEAGRLSNGQAFYAMPLVSGRPLNEAILAAPSLRERSALLPNLLAVADALAYAHDQRIVHRDLKPQNVIVGRFGETVVIDWGLAKDLARPVVEAPRLERELPDGMTMDGVVLGTPHYMPPEQARGEPVDERADVYALGAMLYHLMCGKPPHSGSSAETLIRNVSEQAPVPVHEVTPGVPVNLRAIIGKAMSRDPAARYRNAGELAADLRNFETGQLVAAHRYSVKQRLGRWLRRHRAAASVGAVLLLVLGVTTTVSVRRILFERARAERQREMAQKRGKAAEGMVDFLVQTLYHRLYDLGRLDLFEGIGVAVTSYYDLAAFDDSDVALARGRAKALELLGSVAHRKGDEDGALRLLAASLEVRRQLADRFPAAAEWPTGMASVLGLMSAAHYLKGELPAALRDEEGAIAALERPVVVQANEVNRAHQLVRAWEQIGYIGRMRGDAPGTRKGFQTARQVAEAGLKSHPDDVRAVDDLAETTILVGEAARDAGELDEAARLFRLAESELDAPLKARPDAVDYQGTLALALQNLVAVALERGDFAEMRVVSGRALALSEHLVALDPSNGEQQDRLGSARLNVAEAEHYLGHYLEAERRLEAMLVDADALARKYPGNTRYLDGVGAYLCSLGSSAEEAGQLGMARRALERAAAIYDEKLLPKDGDNVEWQEGGWEALRRLGGLELAQGRAADALPRLRRARELLGKLLVKEPEKPEYLSNLSVSETQLGRAEAALGDRVAARTAFVAALEAGGKLVASDPEARRWQWQERLAETAYEMSVALPDDAAEARPILARQVATLERLRAAARVDAATARNLPRWARALR